MEGGYNNGIRSRCCLWTEFLTGNRSGSGNHPLIDRNGNRILREKEIKGGYFMYGYGYGATLGAGAGAGFGAPVCGVPACGAGVGAGWGAGAGIIAIAILILIALGVIFN